MFYLRFKNSKENSFQPQDRHLAEVRTLQVKLEEQQEKSNTLSEVNTVLRDQVSTAQNFFLRH